MFRLEDGVVLRPKNGRGNNAAGMSGDGNTLVGWSEVLSSYDVPCTTICRWEALEWRVDINELIPLGTLSREEVGHGESWASAASFDGSVIVGWSGSYQGPRHAAIWFSDRQVQRVDDVLAALGIDLSGWQLTWARFVSDDGLTIMGTGTNPAGQEEAWIATIPEPSTALLVGLGLVAISGRRFGR